MLSCTRLCRYVCQDIAFVSTPLLCCYLTFRSFLVFVLNEVCHSLAAVTNVEDVLRSGEDGGALTIMDSGITPLVFEVAYCESDGDYLDVWRSGNMHLHAELLEMCNPSGIRCNMAADAWIRRLKHWDHRGAIECKTSSSDRDMHHVRVFEEAEYERKLSEFLRR